jgi:hypothetical protein
MMSRAVMPVQQAELASAHLVSEFRQPIEDQLLALL